MSSSTWLLIILAIIVIAVGGGYYISQQNASIPTPVTATSTNTQATSTQGLQPVYKNADSSKIVVAAPRPGDMASSTFVVTGQARGPWYFEASFPLQLLSATGTVLAQMPVQAQGEWMTTNFVAYAATVTAPTWYHGPATLILKNDNPSGLPENEASVSLPIIIK